MFNLIINIQIHQLCLFPIMFYSGENNLITDVDGILVGNAEDKEIGTGTTILIPPVGSTAAADVRGGAPEQER